MTTVIQNVIDMLIEPVGLLDKTVDRLSYGDPLTEVTGIVTAFMPTQRVLEQAIALNANLIIAHEDPFYDHQSSLTDVIGEDPVYQAKRELIVNSGLAIYRFHDYYHRYQLDGIMEGLIETLGWSSSAVKHQPTYSVVEVPTMTLLEMTDYIKKKLNISYVRVVGNVDMPCSRVGLLAGYRGGGRSAIPLIEQEKLDLLVYGEGPEWETPEYIRDATDQGRAKSLIVLGHAESEASGMKLLAERIQRRFPSIPVQYVAEKPLFQVL